MTSARNTRWSWITLLFLPFMFQNPVSAQPALYGPAPKAFSDTSHLVSSTFFHWYASAGGQLTGPWRPVEGRENWTGLPPWWKTQIKQVMAANIDMLYVHLIPSTEIRRILFFQALSELRAEGYDVPKVAPFLDPLITWYNLPNVDAATDAGKDSIAAQYIRWYHQYFDKNTDPYAGDYIAWIDEKPVLDTWHVFLNIDNVASMQREDLVSRLSDSLSQYDARFNNGLHMVTTAINNPTWSFADERVAQFEINVYHYPFTYNGLKTVQLKAGYWDQNVRNPGDFLPRDGGIHFRDAWDMVDETVNRVYVESWNEYDEGTGLYAGDVGSPYIHPGSGNTNTDTWSSTNNPYEYIETTARGAAKFNDYPRLDARFLWHEAPAQLNPNATDSLHLIVRNEGNEMWSNAAGFALKQDPADPVQFAVSDGQIDDTEHDIPMFGGIFRGRPIRFDVPLAAPIQVGSYETHWHMMKGDTAIGEVLTVNIDVSGNPLRLNEQTLWAQASLGPVIPNPVSEQATISFDLPAFAADLHLGLYDLLGREIQPLLSGPHAPGRHEVRVAAEGLEAGIYLCLLHLPGGQVLRQKVLVE